MDELNESYYDVFIAALEELAELFHQNSKGESYIGVFNEFIEENELGLALHVLCDYLIQPDTPEITEPQLKKIAELHTYMQLEDACVSILQAKRRSN